MTQQTEPINADRLKALLRDTLATDQFGPKDKAILVIIACIEGGITKGSDIVKMGGDLGLNTKSVGKQLDLGKGINPKLHRWFKRDDGSYALH